MKRSTRLWAAALAAGLVLSCDEGRLVTEIDSEPFEAALQAVTGPDTINVGRTGTFSTAISLGDDVVTTDAIDWTVDPPGLLAFDTTDHGSQIQVVGRSPGLATLRATIDHPDLAADATSAEVVVILLGVEPVAPADGDTTLTALDDTLTVRARGLGEGADADSAGLAWSHEGAALTVSSPTGGRDTLRVTARATGTDTLIFQQMDGYCRDGQCVDTIFVHVSPVPARVAADDSVVLQAVGATARATAAVYDRNGNPVEGAVVAWSLVDPADSAYVGVGADGLLTARENGTAELEARAGSAADTVRVVVRQTIDAVTVAPDLAFAAVGATDTVSLSAVDPGGTPVTRSYAVDWASRATGVADVTGLPDGRAVVTATGAGTAYVVGSAESRRDSVLVTVAQEAATVTVSPDSVTLDALGAVAQLTAAVEDANGNTAPDAVVSWSSTDTGVVQVSAAGEVTANGIGSATVVATSGTAADSAAAVVRQVPASITVTDTVALTALGEVATLSATVRDARDNEIAGATVTWTVVAGDAATVAASGEVTARANGTAHVEGEAGGARDTAAVIVHQAVASVALDTAALSYDALLVADTLGVTAFDSAGAAVNRPYGVTWSSSAPGVATVTQLADTTRAVIRAEGNGAASIAAAVEGKADTADVTVAQAVDSVVITPPADTLNAIGFTTVLAAEPVDANGQTTADPVSWTALDSAIATIGTGDTVTAVAPGTGRFAATAGGVEDTAVVVVRQIAATVTLAPNPVPDTLLAGDTVRLTVAAVDSGGTAIASPSVAWAAVPDTTAVVDTTGLVTGLTVTALDSARVSATVGPAADTTRVFVDVAILTSVSVAPDPDTITALTDTARLVARGLNQNGNPIPGETFTWTARDTGIGTVDGTTGVVTAVANGQTYVVATSDTDGALTDSALVVVEQVPTAVAIAPTTWTFNALADTKAFSATATDAKGQGVAGATFSWSDRLSPVIEHLGGGQFRADAVGSAYAVVSVTGNPAVQDSAAITVQQIPASITISPALDTIPVNGTTALSAAVADSNGNALASPPATVWAALDPDTATVDGSGTVTGVAVGTARIVAYPTGYLDQVMDTAQVVVEAYTLAFDGGDYVTAGTGLDLDATAEPAGFTLEAWVYPTGGTGDEYIASKGGTPASGDKATASWGLFLQDGKPAFYVRHASGNPNAIDSLVAGATLATSTWHHVAVSFDNTTGDATLYVNGSSVASATLAGTPVSSTGTVFFGASGTTPDNPFTGRLDELRVWTGVRSATEIAGSYQAPLTGSETGLRAYWPFDQGTGNSATDTVAGLTATFGTATAGDAAEPTWTAESPTIP